MKANHTTKMKYLLLLPFTLLVCAFTPADTDGSWTATIKNDNVHIRFKKDNEPNSSNSSSFSLSAFGVLPKDQTGEFKLTREAGIILFIGKFVGNEGTGRYKFIPGKDYVDYMNKQGIKDLDEQDLFAFFQVNVTKNYVKVLLDNGYHVTKSELIPLAALNVDEDYIRFWKDNGYKDISASDLIPMRSLNISIDYIKEFQDIGYRHIAVSDLIPMKSLDITASYVKAFQNIGYKNIPASQLIPLKSLGITADYVKGFQDMGFTNMSLSDMIPLKSNGVTPAFVSSMKKKGFNYKTLDKYMQLKLLQD
jgi:hypothetical protein